MKINPYIAHRVRCTWLLKIATVSLFLMSAIPFSVAAQSSDAGADAEPQTVETFWTRDTITGDWGGSRTKLSDKGIDFDFRLSQYYQNVASGGVNENGEYGGTVDYRLNVDGEKLFEAKGWSFNMHARTRYGYDITADAGAFVLPNTGMLMPLPGGYHGTNITGLTATYMFSLFDRPAVLEFGKLDLLDALSGLFPWIGLGQDGFMNTNGVFPVLPMFGPIQGLSMYAVMGVSVNPEYGKVQNGFLVTGTANVSTSWDVKSSFDEGVFLSAFQSFFWGDPKGKTGFVTILGYGSTRAQPSNDPHDFVIIPGQGITSTKSKKPFGALVTVDQEFWKDTDNPNRKANFVIGGSAGSDNPQFAQWSAFANVEVKGLLARRPADRMGVSGWYGGLSPNFKELTSPIVQLQNTWGFEMYYNYQISPWAHLSADLQLVQNQNVGDDFAIIPGLRLILDF